MTYEFPVGGIVEDPIGKGSGLITQFDYGFYIEDEEFVDQGEPITIAGFLSFQVSGLDNPFYQKIKTAPIRVQRMPLVLQIADETYYVQVRSVRRILPLPDNVYQIEDAAIAVLDNLQFLEAIQHDRWINNDHGTK